MIIKQYPFFQDAQQVDSLTLSYERVGHKNKLVLIQNKDQKTVHIALIWINGLPAQYLKGIRSALLPEDMSAIKHRKEGHAYYFDFQNNWDWLTKKRKFKQINIIFRWNESSHNLNLISCLKIAGIKQLIEQTLGKLANQEAYLLFFHNLFLQDDRTPDEYGIGEGDEIEVATKAELTDGPSSLQKATGGSYVSIPDFERYVARMREKINLVCQIILEGNQFGTGFLIDRHLVMTNEHVVRGGLKNGKAKFFYHGNEKPLEVDLHEEVVCFSKSPDKNRVRADALDYAILRLKPGKIDGRQFKTLEEIGLFAKDFFQKALETLKEKESNRHIPLNARVKKDQKRRERANIIQHPLLKDEKTHDWHTQPKQIAFRENRVHEAASLMLHYQSETKPGSSGSPVINDEGEWIGLHYSECISVEIILFRHLEKLCEKLEFQPDAERTDHTAFCFKKENELLYVFRTGEHKRRCSHEKTGENKFTIRDWISKKCKEPSSFITKFLQEQNEPIKQEHLYCNTAVDADSILMDTQKDEKKKKIEAAMHAAQQEWSKFAESIQPWWKTKRCFAIPGGLVVVAIGFAIFMRMRKK